MQPDAPIVVTGGAGGLGSVVAAALAARGIPLVVVDRDAHALEAIAARHGSVGVTTIRSDLSALAEVRRLADRLADGPPLGGLVCNAGGWLPGPQLPEAAESSWLATMALNLLGPMLLTQRLGPRLVAGGAVVHVGSSGGLGRDAYGSPEYGAAKAGLHRFTASLGARTDLRVCAVVPGWIGLPRAQAEHAALPADERRRVGPLIPPERIADEVLRLLDRGAPGEVVEVLHG